MKIFVASSGRCGTGFLKDGFQKFTNISAFHEQEPVLKDLLLYKANNESDVKELKQKATLISQNPFYVDTAHQFMRGFYPYALKAIPNLKVIKLARDPLEVARSRINRRIIPGRTGWLGNHSDVLNTIKVSDKDYFGFTSIQRILLDWIEHENRFILNRDKFKHVSYVTFEALTQNTYNTFKRLFKELGIRQYNISDVQLYRNSNKDLSLVTSQDYLEWQELVAFLEKDYDLSWMNDNFYSRVIKKRQSSLAENNLLSHYNNNVNYTSVTPEFLLKKIPVSIKRNSRVLDLGCGDGRFCEYLAKRYGCKVTGIDFSEARIAKAKSNNSNVNYICESVYDYIKNYNGAKFDYVFMTEVLEHLEFPEVLMTDLHRVGSVLIGSTPKDFPYKAHLQVFKDESDFKNRFRDWNLNTILGSMSESDKNKSTIYFWSTI